MKKEIRNLAIFGTVVALLATGGYVLKKNLTKDVEKDLRAQEEQTREFEEIKIDQVVVYNDGSMTFLMNFPEEYGIDNNHELERVDEIDYIEYYNEDGTKTIVDYPTPAPTEEVKTKTR